MLVVVEPHDTEEGSLLPWPPFARMMLAQAAHAAGDALVAVALAGTLFFSVPTGQARGHVGLYLLLTMTPFALLSPVVGPLLDRWRGSYRIAIFLAMIGRGVLAFLMASRTKGIGLYPLAFGSLVLSRTHGISRGALGRGNVLGDAGQLTDVRLGSPGLIAPGQRTVGYEIGITANRAGEMQIVGFRQAVVSERLWQVARAAEAF